MITFHFDDIFDSNTQVFVNPVNCVGVMGKGLAVSFKKKFPINFQAYATHCYNNRMTINDIFVCQDRIYSKGMATPVWIVNLATKQHWKNPSNLQWVVNGLESLKEFIIDNNIKSVAIPALGCGNGGLQWESVKLVIEEILAPLNNVDIKVYPPQSF